METVDYSSVIVTYNAIIGVLLMLASERIGKFAGRLSTARGESIARLSSVSVFAFGAAVAALSAFVYVVFHLLRIGV